MNTVATAKHDRWTGITYACSVYAASIDMPSKHSQRISRWPGHIKPGTIKDQMFAALDWLPTLVDIAGGPKGDDLRKQIETGSYPGIVKTTLDGFDQRAYLEGTSEESARDVFFYYSGSTPSAVRYKNWKMYYNMAQPGAEGW